MSSSVVLLFPVFNQAPQVSRSAATYVATAVDLSPRFNPLCVFLCVCTTESMTWV